ALDIHPNSVERLVVHRYCAGGWKAVNALRNAIFASLRATTRLDLGGLAQPSARPLGSLHPLSQQSNPPLSPAVSFSKKTAEAIETLELLVSAVLLQISLDALRVARERVPQARARFEADQERYGIKAVEADLGPTDIAPATKGAYTDHPDVQVEGSQVE